jgi:CAAX prenyl protease-like protein
MERRTDHGWWPYLLPMISFLVLVEISRRSAAAADWMLPLKVFVPFAIFLYYLVRRGSYPELRSGRMTAGGALLDVAVGVAGAVLWVAPYLWIDSLRPDPTDAFDPEQLGSEWVGLVLVLRAVGYAVVTPCVEELFVRSWLMRYSDVFDSGKDFRDVPIARFSWRSFLVVVVYFTLSHVPWEYPVAIAWVVGTQLWFYRRKSLVSLILVHAVSNLSIFGFVVLFDGRLSDGAGSPLSLWFFL